MLNVTVNTNSNQGFFGLGGKSNLSVRVQPALTKSQNQGGQSQNTVMVTHNNQTRVIETNMMSDVDPLTSTTPRNHRNNRSVEKLRDPHGRSANFNQS